MLQALDAQQEKRGFEIESDLGWEVVRRKETERNIVIRLERLPMSMIYQGVNLVQNDISDNGR